LLLYWRMLRGLPWPNIIMECYWGFLAMSYVVVQVFTFVECHPVYLYWQVVPDPGLNSHHEFRNQNSNKNYRQLRHSSSSADCLLLTEHNHRRDALHPTHALAHNNETLIERVSRSSLPSSISY
jgi:hypothetical protein